MPLNLAVRNTVFFPVLHIMKFSDTVLFMKNYLVKLLQQSCDLDASDLHLSSGASPWLRVDGVLQQLGAEPVLKAEDLEVMLLEIMSEKIISKFSKQSSVDFAYFLPNQQRFRVNVFQSHSGIAAAFRIIPDKIFSLEELGMPKILEDFARFFNGLILVTSPTGSGKSTTLASLVDFINNNSARHIITIEDPIEYVYQNKKSLINQREVGIDTESFQAALKSALREDPDILLVGELRDLETIRLALTAAETGHLVLATLHTVSAARTITRIVDVFPGSEQPLVRVMLAETLRAVVSQVLCKKREGGRVAATEVLVVNPAISNLIRENKTAQVYSQIQTGAKYGMHTLEQNLDKIGTMLKIEV